ncbi:hypothetical protein [Aquicella lusitana]|mgnify:CR=1 FL=1|uniref:Uncharacterized protein n=1 Tax=Aquicella lusitana TaxID=254246 RepID=A0A370GWS8_9COXI|nr:hypothetical protein [Aquicella lusitana]RDI48117.1 hypothetical protein C8D86_10382 [Aquicella lusitana]VVC72867.1 hypothetical protein AQULUS_05910 [Aquicella lusitana]
MRSENLLTTLQNQLNAIAKDELKGCTQELQQANNAIKDTLKGLQLADKRSHAFLGDDVETHYLKNFIKNIMALVTQINQEEQQLEHVMGPQKDFSYHPDEIKNFMGKVILREMLVNTLDKLVADEPALRIQEDTRQAVAAEIRKR